MQLCTSDLQFGFKAKRSTNMCTMLLKEAVAYYINNGSSVLFTILDGTKAFDPINNIKLFEILLQCQLPPVCERFLANIHRM